MKCPFKFANPCSGINEECRHDYAWCVEDRCGTYTCAMSIIASKGTPFYPSNIVKKKKVEDCGGWIEG